MNYEPLRTEEGLVQTTTLFSFILTTKSQRLYIEREITSLGNIKMDLPHIEVDEVMKKQIKAGNVILLKNSFFSLNINIHWL